VGPRSATVPLVRARHLPRPDDDLHRSRDPAAATHGGRRAPRLDPPARARALSPAARDPAAGPVRPAGIARRARVEPSQLPRLAAARLRSDARRAGRPPPPGPAIPDEDGRSLRPR